MSSPRLPLHADGVIVQEGRPVGPLKLPRKSTDTFVVEFNDRYQSLGLQIGLVREPDVKRPDAVRRTGVLLRRDAGDPPTVGTTAIDNSIV